MAGWVMDAAVCCPCVGMPRWGAASKKIQFFLAYLGFDDFPASGTPFGFPPLHVHHAHLNPSMAVLDPEDGMDGQFIEVSQRGVLWSSLNWISAKILAEVRLRHR